MTTLRPCIVPGCGKLTDQTRCPRHRRRAWRTTTSSRHARGYDAAWQRTRAAVLQDEPVCRACRQHAATTVDHIVPLAHGGARLDRANLQPLCVDCHTDKTQTDQRRRP